LFDKLAGRNRHARDQLLIGAIYTYHLPV
jgi:hypothetical protein